MTTNVRDSAGLGEVRLRPEEEDANPFNVFTKQIPDKIITGCKELNFPPFNSLLPDSTTVTYQCPPLSKQFIKLDATRLYGSARILEIGENGELKDPAATVDISVVNNLPSSIFNSVSVRFNDLDLDQGSAQAYPYKVILYNISKISSYSKVSWVFFLRRI